MNAYFMMAHYFLIATIKTQDNDIRVISVLMLYTAMVLKDVLMCNHIIMSQEIESSVC